MKILMDVPMLSNKACCKINQSKVSIHKYNLI
jgi:hypothetical protein